MADIYVSYINPIRFRRNVAANDLPRVDEMRNRTQYYQGVYPVPHYKPSWKLNEEIVIQIQTDLTGQSRDELELFVNTPSGTTTVSSTDVTPTGWLVDGNSGTVFNYSYTPTELGDYQFTVYNPDVSGLDLYISDIFTVVENDMNLVELQYYDTKNSFDGVFYDDTTLIWSPKAYFTGIAIAGIPNRELSVYNDDPNTPIITRGNTQRTIDLSITDITINHRSQIIDMLSCDRLFVNNQPALSIDDIEPERAEKSDGESLTTTLIRIEDNNFVKNY